MLSFDPPMCRTESLLLEKLSNGTPVAVDDILSLLPDAKKYLKWKAEVAPPGPTVRVGEGFQRVGTGKTTPCPTASACRNLAASACRVLASWPNGVMTVLMALRVGAAQVVLIISTMRSCRPSLFKCPSASVWSVLLLSARLGALAFVGTRRCGLRSSSDQAGPAADADRCSVETRGCTGF